MKNAILWSALGFALLTGCASPPGVAHTSEFYDVVLSPQHRTDVHEGLSLVAISNRGRVTIRKRGTLFSARADPDDNHFKEVGGPGWSDDTLKSVDIRTGRVVLTREVRLYYR